MTEQLAHIGWLGWIVFAIVMGSMGFVVLAAVAGGNPKPRPKVTLVFLGSLVTLLAVVLAGMWVAGLAFSVVMG